MIEVLPAILEKTFEGVRQKCERLRGVADRAQLDIADGVFVPEESWRDAGQFSDLETDVVFDLHMMVDKPEQYITQWNHERIFRFTFHHSATYDVLRTIKRIKETGKEVGVALNLETPVERVFDVLGEIDAVQVMGIVPGAQGRDFDPKAIEKVRQVRERDPHIAIVVDGGVSPLVAPGLIAAGATVLVSGSYLFGEEDIQAAIQSLQG
ncbi:MAG: hypothetical protein U1C18_02745 [Patescibacteria group bacterium]|nr:hypothetical protein [bacterium]MDZ4221769.1 hypothetical protein [Patescibacteria group bacterium]